MKKWNRIALTALALIMIFALSACKKESPSEVVEKELKDIQTEDVKDLDVPFMDEDSAESKGITEKYNTWLKKIQKFDYKILSEKTDKKKGTATVKVKLTTYNFGAAYKEAYDQVVADAKDGKVTSATDVEKYTFNIMFDKMNAVKDKDYKKTIDIKLKYDKDDKEWDSDMDNNQEFVDAMLGGMMTQISAITGAQGQ